MMGQQLDALRFSFQFSSYDRSFYKQTLVNGNIRLGHTHQCQMWTTIKAEQGDRFLLPVLQNQTDGIAVRRADFQRMLHGILQSGERMCFQQAQDLDEFTSPRAVEFRFQAMPENPKADGQFPIFQWPSMIEAARFSFQKCQIMHGIEQRLLLFPAALMPSDKVVFKDDADFIDCRHNCQRAMRIFRGDRIVIPVKANKGQ